MKKITIGLAVLFACAMFSVVNAQPAAKKVAPGATFKRTWVDYNIKENNRNGMRIHTAFNVTGMKDVSSYLKIRFQNADGAILKDNNNAFNSAQGEVAVFGSLKPGYDTADYDDMALFIPYDELDLPGGKFALKMDIDVIYENGDLVQHLGFYDFDFTNPEKTTTPVTNSAVSAKFDRMWIDYDVTEGGKLGMRIHVKMMVYGMKNVDGYLAIYFSKKDGAKLYGNNESYRSKDGQIAVYMPVKPGYDPADYDDLQIFMPYSELTLTKGTYNLQMDTDMIYKNGDLVNHLTYYDFEFKKN